MQFPPPIFRFSSGCCFKYSYSIVVPKSWWVLNLEGALGALYTWGMHLLCTISFIVHTSANNLASYYTNERIRFFLGKWKYGACGGAVDWWYVGIWFAVRINITLMNSRLCDHYKVRMYIAAVIFWVFSLTDSPMWRQQQQSHHRICIDLERGRIRTDAAVWGVGCIADDPDHVWYERTVSMRRQYVQSPTIRVEKMRSFWGCISVDY